MKRFFVKGNLEVGNSFKIDGIEHNHIKNVMRLDIGEEIILVNGDEYDYFAVIESMSKGDTTVRITGKEKNIYNAKSQVSVFQALVKSDNMNLIIQKLTELGVNDFYPFESEFITSKDKFGKREKMQEVSNQSIKQCKRSIPMNIHNTLSFKDMLNKLSDYDIVIFANECEKEDVLQLDKGILKDKNIAIIVGSEGGFSDKEIQLLKNNGVKSITMGKRILRAETAVIALTSVVMFAMGEWNYE
jgi:16S rRNA (uracil1498-N3)-methyltransferase